METKLKLPPWVQGPYELINHSVEHFNKGGDFDRRIALIGFDNAIELSIDIYLNLPPEVRNGRQISRAEIDNARNNFYRKVDFLKQLFQDKNILNELPYREIIWYHNLRNELYHSGNGMVPEIHVIEGAKSATLLVFMALFDIDLTIIYGKKTISKLVEGANRPLKDGELVRQTIKNDGYIQVWKNKNRNVLYFICELPDGRFGLQVFKWFDSKNELSDITAYVKDGVRNLQELELFLVDREFEPYSGNVFPPTPKRLL